jgi:hypothetical protein
MRFELAGEGRGLLDRVLRANRRIVEDAFERSGIAEPVFALALWPSQDPSDLSAVWPQVATDSDRARLAALGTTRYERFRWVWNGAEYAITLETQDPAEIDGAFEFDSATLAQLIAEGSGGAEHAPLYVMRELARDFNERPPSVPLAEPFIAFALDRDVDEELLETIELVSSPSTRETLRDMGLFAARMEEIY